MTTPRIAAEGLAWAVGPRYILLDLDLALPGGCLVALTGDNGTGKTSLLHLLGGLIAPTAGRVLLDGHDIAQLELGYVGRRIGWLGHQPGLYLDLSARENTHLFAALSGRPASPDTIAETLDFVGLSRRDRDRPVRGFSRGMKQRASLARVIATGADVWLLDEPTTGLDVSGRARLMATIADAVQRGITVVAASHRDEITQAADDRLHLHAGQLAKVAAPR